MNIFYIHENPELAAKAMTNKHVIKMVLESAQLLCTAHRVLDGTQVIVKSKSGSNLKKWKHPNEKLDSLLYKSTHVNHPSAIWIRESCENYMWLYKHFIALGQEYKRRYNKTHKSIEELSFALASAPANIKCVGQTPVHIAISNHKWHKDTALDSYRAYYLGEKINTPEDLKRYISIIEEHNVQC